MAEAQPLPERSYDGQLERKLEKLAAGANPCRGAGEGAEVENGILNDTQISQQLTRREADGFDTLFGYFRCPFELQQQRYVLHVPLFPAMEHIPEVEAIVIDCEHAKIRITDRQKFGLRMEIVLGRPANEELKLLVEVTAYSCLA